MSDSPKSEQISKESYQYFGDCSNVLYSNFQLTHNVIMLNKPYEINEIHHEKILNCKFVLVCTQKIDIITKLTPTNVDANNIYIYQFNHINDIHFIVPFTINSNTVNLYVGFPENDNYVLFKTFSINNNEENSKICYFLNMIEMYQYPIKDHKQFFDKMGIKIIDKDIPLIKNGDNLLNFLFYGSVIKKSKTGKTVLHRLVDELNITQLTTMYNQSFTSKYIAMSFYDDNKYEYNLVTGYLRRMEETLNLSSLMPSTLIQLIVLYQQYYVIRGNDLCIIHPKQKIITTKLLTNRNIKAEHSFIIISKPLITGIWSFKIQCMIGAKHALSIGIITNLDANPEKSCYLFDDKECGESYQLYLSSSSRTYENCIYHFRNGQQVYDKSVENVKCGALKKGECLEIMIDFDKYQVSFLFDSKQCGPGIEIEKNSTYFAAFAVVPNNIHYQTSGHDAFKFSLNPCKI